MNRSDRGGVPLGVITKESRMTQIDSRRFATVAATKEAESFQDMLAEQMQRAPWFAVSLAAHAIGILMLWLLIPAETKPKAHHHAEVVDTTQQMVQPPEKQKPIEADPDVAPDDITLVDPQILDTDSVDVADDITTETLSAFTNNQWNTAVGIGGGAASNRRGGDRGARKRTAPREFQLPVQFALGWLARHQDDDGKWDSDQFMKHDVDGIPCDGAGNAVHDVGVTGLALLAFLGDNNTMRGGPYRENVKKAVLWLRSQQQENGLFGNAMSHDFIYDHAIATYAMCEAYGLSRYRLLEPTAQRGLNYLESHRNPYGVWRYQPRDLDGDTSIAGWAIMAYESGEFFGLQVNRSALQLAAAFLDQVTDATGRHGYHAQGELSSRKPGSHEARFPVAKGEAMTAVGLFCRFFMGQDPKQKPEMKAAADLIVGKPPVWNEKDGSIDHYYWYYATYALFQMGGDRWRDWQRHLVPAVVKTQHRSPSGANLTGSWDPAGAWGEEGGRVYSTAILALTLEAHYRYSPLLR
ncbi:MAG: terpene cyclase/mutase family protein [Planctomycetes bacterium]|nr:terpene cyclase/mutase family protein [Planctomycetota bacterium]